MVSMGGAWGGGCEDGVWRAWGGGCEDYCTVACSGVRQVELLGYDVTSPLPETWCTERLR